MKKLIVVILVALFINANAAAQENGKNVIKINPLGALLGSYSMSYERVVANKSTVQLDGFYGNINLFGLKVNSYGAGAGFRYYFSKNKSTPEGFFVSPSMAYSNITLYLVDTPNDRFQVGTFEGGAVGGYQWIFDSGFQIDVYLGPRYISVTNFSIQSPNTDVDLFVRGLSGIGTKLGFSVGYSF